MLRILHMLYVEIVQCFIDKYQLCFRAMEMLRILHMLYVEIVQCFIDKYQLCFRAMERNATYFTRYM